MKIIIYIVIGVVIGYLLWKNKSKMGFASPNQEGVAEKQKRLDQIMDYFNSHEQVTNDEIEKMLNVSDTSTGRYLEELEVQGKIAQVGKTGRSVIYKKKKFKRPT